MTARRLRRFGSLFFVWLAAIVIALWMQRHPTIDDVIAEAIICAILVPGLAAINRRLLSRMRRWPLYAFAPVAGAVYAAAILIAVTIVVAAFSGLATGSLSGMANEIGIFFSTQLKYMVYPFVIAVGLVLLIDLIRRIGPPRIWDLLRGRYRNPREETRVFLLIDLRGSTPLAESLGAVQFSRLLRDVFDDLTEPVLNTGGDVVGYVGDEAILSWPVERGLRNANALRCYLLFKTRIAARSKMYLDAYGAVPKFRAAIHAGPIVATEVGQIRTDVALHGDALNTAARVLGECNALDAELLMTETVSSRLSGVPGTEIQPLGQFHLRGKGEPIELSRLVL
jgi:adenylate cyclase